jgi:hypothetical protein
MIMSAPVGTAGGTVSGESTQIQGSQLNVNTYAPVPLTGSW